MDYSKISIVEYSTQTLSRGANGDASMMWIKTVRKIDPPPPIVVIDFINFLTRKCIPIYSGTRMITYTDDRRDQLIDYMNRLEISARRLFYMSAIVYITAEEYAFLASISDEQITAYQQNIMGDICGISFPPEISTITTS